MATKNFPINTTNTGVGIPPPNWFRDPIPAQAAGVKTNLIDGSVSTLRNAATVTGGRVTVVWDVLLDAQVLAFLDWWNEVETLESFGLPGDFFQPGWPLGRTDIFLKLSPTSNWRFDEKPTIEQQNLQHTTITAIIEGSIN